MLGLTFTTKATHELGTRIRESLRAAGILRAPGDRAPVDPRSRPTTGSQEPTVSTYNAYAASLLNRARPAASATSPTPVVANASRYQLAARVVGLMADAQAVLGRSEAACTYT